MRWFANLFPQYEVIGIQGYGHRIAFFDIPDSSYIQVNRKNIPRKWLVWVNSIYSGLFSWKYRPNTWKEYSEIIMDLRQSITRLLTQYERGSERYFRRKNPVNLYSGLITPNRDFFNRLKKSPSLPKSAVDPWGFIRETSSNKQSVKSIYEPKGVVTSKFNYYSKAIREYIFSLNNFFDHSQHALILTEKKRVLSEQERRRTFEIITKHCVKERLVSLSIVNLFDAKSRLLDFQTEFRGLLLPFVDEGILSSLERQEQQVYDRLWGLWYFFAFEPYRLEKNARIRFSSIFKQQFEHYMAKIEAGFESEISGNNTVETLDTALRWDEGLTYVISINSSNGWNLYEQLNTKLRTILIEAVKDIRLRSVSYFAINLKMRQLLIVPLINGKMLNKTAYHLPIVTLLSTKEPHEINFALQPLPDEIIDQLEQNSIYFHEGKEINLARNLMEEVANIHAIVAHVYDLVSIPEIEDDDFEAIQAYITRTFTKLSDVTNKAIQQLGEIAELLNNFTFTNSENQKLAVEALQLLSVNLLSDEIGDDGHIQLEKLEVWRNQLVNALGAAFALCTAMASEM